MKKILFSINLLQIILLVFVLHRVGYIKFDKKEWDNSYMSSVTYKDKYKLFENYLHRNNYNNSIIFLGDSITEKIDWSELLSNENILNRGIGGDTISGLCNRTESIVNLKPSKVLIMIGINDISLGGGVKEMSKKYINLIEKLQETNVKIVILSTLYTQIDKYNKKVTLFNDFLKEYALKKELIYIDLNQELSMNNKLKNKYSLDGVHLTYSGYLAIANKIKTVVEK